VTFVVTSGQLAALERSQGAYRSSVRVTDRLALSYADIWRTQPQVRTVVSFLSRNIAQIGCHVYRRVSDTDRTRLTDHPLAAILAKPNPRTTRYRFFESLVSDLGIHDNALWAKAQVDGQPYALIRLDPSRVTPLGDSWMWADGYRLQGNRGYRDFTPDQVVHFHGYNPADQRWGVSPLETLRGILAEEYEAGNWREQLWRNGARFPGYIARPKDAGDWSDRARSRFVESWKGLYTGDGPGAGGTPVLEDGMTFQATGITPEQAQYLETRKLTREEVAAAFHIPLPMVGILDHATFSNIKEQHQQLYQDTLGPWLSMIAEDLMLQLLPDLDGSADVYLEFNLAEKMRGSFEEQAATMQTATGGPWMTRNEARARVNLPAIDGADELVVPLNVTAGGQASPTDSAPKSGAALAKSFIERQARVLATGRELDRDRWTTELTEDLTALMEAK
jgi:HK97 family phage portal protein